MLKKLINQQTGNVYIKTGFVLLVISLFCVATIQIFSKNYSEYNYLNSQNTYNNLSFKKNDLLSKKINYPTQMIPANATIISATSDPKGKDSITVSYWGSDNAQVYSCASIQVYANQQITSKIYIEQADLVCKDLSNSNKQAKPVVLIKNVDGFKLSYKVKPKGMLNNNNSTAHENFITAGANKLDLAYVNEVKSNLLIKTTDKSAGLSKRFYNLDEILVGPFNDNIKRKNIILRNILTK